MKNRIDSSVQRGVYLAIAKIFMPWVIKHPKSIPAMAHLVVAYRNSLKIRTEEELKQGLKVPFLLILSVTSKCNLKCAGCYATSVGTVCNNKSRITLNLYQWQKIIKEARDLGVFGFIIAGGEPFLIPNLLELGEKFKDSIFLIFTNGTKLKNQDYEKLKKLKNVITIISVEGDQQLTDLRRGIGVYEKAINTINRIDSLGGLSGISVTITRNNFKYWMNPQNIDILISKGVKIGFFMEYIPVDNDTDLMLSNKESVAFRKKIIQYRKTKKMLIIHSPGDEEYMGGCVSAGRGFAHVTPSGDLTPCPVSDIATHNLTKSTLREGLMSPLFKIIRESEQLLETNNSPCALFAHPNEVQELAKKVNAYRANK